MACNHNSRGWRAPADTRNDGDDGWRCVDCGLVLCLEFVNGDLRSPNGKRPFGREFCDRVATLVGTWTDKDGKTRKHHYCGIHRRRNRWQDPVPFDNVPQKVATPVAEARGVAVGRG